MPLTLLAGPANAGKVSRLLERYRGALTEDPILIVPNRSDVEPVERELLEATGALLGGSIGTFDDVFEQIGRSDLETAPLVTDVQRRLLLRRVVEDATPDPLRPSARFAGFADSLAAAIDELEAGLVEPGEIKGDLAPLVGAYRAELERLGLTDRALMRARAARRVATELAAWDARPVFAYGFEDLTGAQWSLLEGFAARSDVTVSLPYEPDRLVFASLRRTADDLSALAAGRIEELPAAPDGTAHPALAHLERALFGETRVEPPPLEGAVRFLEGAGTRATLELLAHELLELLRSGLAPEQVAVVCPSLERWRAPLETALTSAEIPFAVEGRVPLGATRFGFAFLSLLRFVWLAGGRKELYAFLRSPYAGLPRAHADYLEGRLRGRAIHRHERVEEETVRLRGRPLPALEELRAASSILEGARTLARSMLRAAYGLETPPVGRRAELDLRAHEAATGVLDELEQWQQRGGAVREDELLSALERTTLRSPGAGESGRVAILDLLRARTRRVEVVFLLGLEEGSLPRRSQVSPFLDDADREELERGSRHGRLPHADPLERDRYLFYTACTRASRRLLLVREAATDDGAPRQASPFWEEARACFAPTDVDRWTRRRRLSALTWSLEAAPTERERLRALAALASEDPEDARALAVANGWERRLERALGAFERRTRLSHPAVLEELGGRKSFGVTELEAFATCSSIWFVERLLDPKTIDAEVDARLRGQIAHGALFRFFNGLPKRLGADRVEPDRLEDALVFLRECLRDALAGHARLDLEELDRQELEQGLARDLEHFVRQEAEQDLPLVPRRFEVLFGSERAAPELQRGLDLGTFTLSGKIDRIDVDPFSARGIVQDYKSGKTVHSAARIESELKLQIPLYMLVLRDLVGLEPLGGLYRALAGERQARGMLRAAAREDGLPGFVSTDYLDEPEFWSQVDRATEHARGFAGRIRGGDVQHDPLNGFPCPSWCQLWAMCRVKRA